MIKQNDIICFVHIEKTGGTTLQHIFRRMFYLRHLTVRPYFKPENYEHIPYSGTFSAKDLQLVLRLNPFIKVISGHALKPYADLELSGKRIKYVTILRNPVSRYLSHYEHSKRVVKMKWTFDEYMNIEEHNNFQTRKIAGKEDLNLAKSLLSKKFFAVGVIEQFDSLLAFLSFKLKLGKSIWKYEVKNIGKNKDLVAELHSKYLKKIVSKNELDMQLYNYVAKTIHTNNTEKLNEYFLHQNTTERTGNLSMIDKLKIKSDFYFESFYFELITNRIRRINGLKPKGCYL